MQHFFITGATGFVGQHLIKELKKNPDFSIRALVYEKELENRLPGVKLNYGDIRNHNLLAKLFSENPIDIIVHLAAVIKSPRQEDYFEINIKGTENLVRLAERYEVKKFIFTSTDLVIYDLVHPYRETKLKSEEILFHSSLDFTIFRPTPIYGPGDTKNFADLVSLIKKLPIIPVVQCAMEPVYVGDVVMAINKTINNPSTVRQIYNLPGGSFYEFPEIFRIISKILKLNRLIVPLSGKLFIPAFLFYKKLFPNFPLDLFQIEKWLKNKPLDTSNIKKDLNYNPLTFEDGMRLTLPS